MAAGTWTMTYDGTDHDVSEAAALKLRAMLADPAPGLDIVWDREGLADIIIPTSRFDEIELTPPGPDYSSYIVANRSSSASRRVMTPVITTGSAVT